MTKLIALRRSDLSSGVPTSKLDIDTIRQSMVSQSPELSWEGFFVLAARDNRISPAELLTVFAVAWDQNRLKADRWKLLTKLGYHRVLLDQAVINRVVSSDNPKEWQVYLEEINNGSDVGEFSATWKEIGGDEMVLAFAEKSDPEWLNISQTLSFLSKGHRSPLGGAAGEAPPPQHRWLEKKLLENATRAADGGKDTATTPKNIRKQRPKRGEVQAPVDSDRPRLATEPGEADNGARPAWDGLLKKLVNWRLTRN